MSAYDVVVAGAGPAGSVTALLLARAGLRVHLIERAAFPRRKVCGEYLGSGAVDALERLGLLGAVRPHAVSLRGIRLVPPGGAGVALPFPRPSLACPRTDLDAVLLDAALAAGATVERARVEDVVISEGACCGLVVRTADGARAERHATTVVGADGSGSVVARKLGLTRAPRGTPRYAVGGHYAGLGTFDGFVEMYVGAGAYFALNPLDGTRVNVMVVVPKARLARWSADVDAGMSGEAAALARGVRSCDAARRMGARVSVGPLAHEVRAPVARGALLVGDAAGFLDPFTGQGVMLALTGAERAADAILRGEHAAYALWRTADVRARKRLSAAVKLLIDVPPLARRATARLARSPQLGVALLDALGGSVAPQRALQPGFLRRLLA